MANEWKKVELYGANNDGNPVRYTIANDAAVSQGTVLQLLDERTASCGVKQNTPIAGISSEEHLPNVGVTSISCWTNGLFRATTSAAVTVGHMLQPTGGGSNLVSSCAEQSEPVNTGIRAYDTAADATEITVGLNLP